MLNTSLFYFALKSTIILDLCDFTSHYDSHKYAKIMFKLDVFSQKILLYTLRSTCHSEGIYVCHSEGIYVQYVRVWIPSE